MSFIIELKKEKKALLERLDAVNLLLQSYGESEVVTTKRQKDEIIVDFDLGKELKKSSTPQKFLLVLKDNARFMKIREMAQFLVAQIGGDENEWTMKLSRTTGKLKKMDKIVSYKVGKSNTNVFWGSPNWLDKNGAIKTEHKFKESVVDKNQGSLLIDI